MKKGATTPRTSKTKGLGADKSNMKQIQLDFFVLKPSKNQVPIKPSTSAENIKPNSSTKMNQVEPIKTITEQQSHRSTTGKKETSPATPIEMLEKDNLPLAPPVLEVKDEEEESFTRKDTTDTANNKLPGKQNYKIYYSQEINYCREYLHRRGEKMGNNNR